MILNNQENKKTGANTKSLIEVIVVVQQTTMLQMKTKLKRSSMKTPKKESKRRLMNFRRVETKQSWTRS